MAKEDKLSGVDKAAIFLMYLGEDVASEVFKHLSTNEIQSLSSAIVKAGEITREMVEEVDREFLETVESSGVLVEGSDFARNALIKALGPEKAEAILERAGYDAGEGGIEALKGLAPAMVADMLKLEHPQIIALIMVYLDPEHAAQVLEHFPERLRGEVMLRVATLDRIPYSALKELEEVVRNQVVDASTGGQGRAVDGVKAAAEIMNQVGASLEGSIIGTIEKASPDIATRIQEKMFVFSDLMIVDDKGLQQVLKELSTDTLTMALKGADDALKEKFFSNMSERAAEMLKEDLESKGPVKLSDVEAAQQEIVKVARRLEQEGKLMREGRGGGGGEVYV
ncbi:MAG TPA: flagellar motor switch protein FliG [Deltaproteobacteria bacterium]|nr:flagellar motor switch protein FliG [Deltaproteobacteria bacterium]